MNTPIRRTLSACAPPANPNRALAAKVVGNWRKLHDRLGMMTLLVHTAAHVKAGPRL